MTTYEKVTYRPEGQRARTVILRDPTVIYACLSDTDVLCGTEVDKEANAVLAAGKDTIERHHIIDVALVIKRVPVVFDGHYCTFVEA